MTGKFNFLKIALSLQGNLSEQEELELVKKYQAGDVQAFKRLRLSLRKLIEKAISDAMPSNKDVSASVLRMKADVELKKLLQNFNPNQGAKLKTYILANLSGVLRNTTAENMSGPYVPRNVTYDLNRYKQSIREAELEFGSNPSEDQIKKFYEKKNAKQDFNDIKKYHVKSYQSDAVFGEDSDGAGIMFKDQFVDDDNTVTNDDLYSGLYQEEQDNLVSENFSESEKKVIDLVTKKGQSFVQVALSLSMSTGEIRKIMRRWYDLKNK